MQDTQGERVYQWEETFADWCRRTLTLPETRGYVWRACQLYGIEPPKVRRGCKTEAETEEPHKFIVFLEKHQNPACALHESAHIICDAIFGVELEAHCPEWLGIYLALLEEFKVAPRAALHASARRHGLRWLASSRVSPRALSARAGRKPRRAGR